MRGVPLKKSGDGWLDLFVPNNGVGNHLYTNRPRRLHRIHVRQAKPGTPPSDRGADPAESELFQRLA